MPRIPPKHPWFFEQETPISTEEATDIGDLGNELDQEDKEPTQEEKNNERTSKDSE